MLQQYYVHIVTNLSDCWGVQDMCENGATKVVQVCQVHVSIEPGPGLRANFFGTGNHTMNMELSGFDFKERTSTIKTILARGEETRNESRDSPWPSPFHLCGIQCQQARLEFLHRHQRLVALMLRKCWSLRTAAAAAVTVSWCKILE